MSEFTRMYRTSNLYLSAVLIAFGVKMVETEIEYDKKHGRYGLTFVFSNFDETKDIVQQHFDNLLKVSSFDLINAYLDVKNRSKEAMLALKSTQNNESE